MKFKGKVITSLAFSVGFEGLALGLGLGLPKKSFKINNSYTVFKKLN